MTSPSAIKVFHAYVDVEILPDAEMGDDEGRVDMSTLTIEVCESLRPHRRAEVIWHELCHVLWYMLAIEHGEKEESIVHRLSVGQVTVLRDNPGFAEWIIRCD